ncbi:MAG TPA: ABC transporter ATP-binding protein [Gammaproteobacteria bacterium]|nr:ABC transporter ATP-binding protein [Gammaproteobacteria bacterium]
MAESPVLLSCSGVDISIGEVTITRRLELCIEAGQCWCLLGRNGTGKTTLLQTLAGLRPPAAGRIALNGTALEQLPRRQVAQQLGILFQDFEDSFPASVLETVLQGRHPHLHNWQWESAEDYRIARAALAELGLDSLEQRNVQTLSGGERQRVGIATLLAQQTPLLLLDEPTSHLDLQHQLDILQTLVAQCRARNSAVLMVLHDINLAARFADHVVLLMGNGEHRLGRSEDILQTDQLEQLYGHPLMQIDTATGPAWLPR